MLINLSLSEVQSYIFSVFVRAFRIIRRNDLHDCTFQPVHAISLRSSASVCTVKKFTIQLLSYVCFLNIVQRLFICLFCYFVKDTFFGFSFCLYVCTLCVQCLWSPEEGVGSLGMIIMACYELLFGSWKTEPGFSTREPSLLALIAALK